MRTYCTRNGSCVGSDIGWRVSIPIQELTVGYSLTGRMQKVAKILLFMANAWRLHRLFLQDGSSKGYA